MAIQELCTKISRLWKQGISIIPTNKKKQPYRVKEGFRKERKDIFELLDEVDENCAVVLGEISGGLVCIDVDTKYKEGFYETFLSELGKEYREFLDKVWIDRTRSGGSHLFYKVSGGVTEFKIEAAGRDKFKEEEGTGKYRYFLEILGDGHLCELYFDGDEKQIPTFTIEQHYSIVSFCCAFDERTIEEEGSKGKSGIGKFEEIYTSNPFVEFNNSERGSLILKEEGWGYFGKVAGKFGWCRPGTGLKNLGATFDSEWRNFKFYSSKVDYDVISPSNYICRRDFGGDKSQMYEWLVSEGFGKLKPQVEKNIIRRLVVSGADEYPKNFSEKAVEEFKEEKKKFSESFPYGTFWSIGEKGGIVISQKGVDTVITEMGYKIHRGNIYKSVGYLLISVTEGELFHTLLDYCGDDKEIYDSYSKFINQYNKLTVNRLKEFGKIPIERLLISTKEKSYKFYRNCYVCIDSDGIECVDYSDINEKFIFKDLVLDRDFVFEEKYKKGMFFKFLSLAIKTPDVLKIIGYLVHDFIDNSMNAIIVASEECEDSKKGGGSGKNLFFNLMNRITTVHVIPGRQVEMDKNLLQSFGGQRILVISDVSKNFDYTFFKDFSSGAASLKKLYQDVVVLKRKEMPKPVVLTNYSYEVASGLERRIIPLEFTEFFSRIRGGVGKHFKCMFPGFDSDDNGDWNDFEWNCFDTICCIGIMEFLKAGELIPSELSDTGWRKQFKQVHNETTFNFIEENLMEWVDLGRIETDYFNKVYDDFFRSNSVNIKWKLTSQSMNKAISEFCEHQGIEFNKMARWSESGIDKSGRTFGKKIQEIKEPF